MLFIISNLCTVMWILYLRPLGIQKAVLEQIFFFQNRPHSFILSIKLGRAQNQDAKPWWPALGGRDRYRAGSAEEEEDNCYSHICVVRCHTLTAWRHNGGLPCSGGGVYSGWMGGGEVSALHLLSMYFIISDFSVDLEQFLKVSWIPSRLVSVYFA